VGLAQLVGALGQKSSIFALQNLYNSGRRRIIMPKETIMSKISDEKFEEIVNSSSSLKEIAYKCGYSNNSGASSKIVKRRISRQNIVFKSSHGERVKREDKDIFIEDSPVD
jgi:hypothetical protein